MQRREVYLHRPINQEHIILWNTCQRIFTTSDLFISGRWQWIQSCVAGCGCHFVISMLSAQLSLCCEKRTVVYMRSVPTTSRKIYQKWYIFQIVPSIFCMKQGGTKLVLWKNIPIWHNGGLKGGFGVYISISPIGTYLLGPICFFVFFVVDYWFKYI